MAMAPKVADASPIPTMIYNNPGNTAGINIDSDMYVLFLSGIAISFLMFSSS